MKLNLGCGRHRLAGYLNVDRVGEPDAFADLETFPWPWPDNGAEEILLIHVLEHLGASYETFRRVIRELYRVCAPGALVRIRVPHPRSDDFLGDPTHVRPITKDSLLLFSKTLNRSWAAKGVSNSSLALDWDVDFDFEQETLFLDDEWSSRYNEKAVSAEELAFAVKHFHNVIRQAEYVLRARK